MKTKFITLSTTIMLGMGSMLSVPAVKAESNQIKIIQAQKSDIETKIQRMEQAVKDNDAKIAATNLQITETQTEMDRLKTEIAVIQDRITQRSEVLKERAVSLQENGGQIGYLEVILGSSSFSDFISRVGAVAAIVDADNTIISEHEADKAELEEKQGSVEKKLTELNNMKVELEGMQAAIAAQKAQSEALKAQLQQQLAGLTTPVTAAAANSTSTTTSKPAVQKTYGSDAVSIVINAGYKYIGNSVYVFGGGRTQSDINNGRFDCSGFVSWAYSQAGIHVGTSTSALSGTGTRVSASEMRPGDMVFFNTYKTNGHVGIYIGGGKFIGSQDSTGVAIVSMNSGYWAQHFSGNVRRVIE